MRHDIDGNEAGLDAAARSVEVLAVIVTPACGRQKQAWACVISL